MLAQWVLKWFVNTHNGLLFSHIKDGVLALQQRGSDLNTLCWVTQVRERQVSYDLTYGAPNKQKPQLIGAENGSVVTRVGGWGVGKMAYGGQKVQTSSYKYKSLEM